MKNIQPTINVLYHIPDSHTSSFIFWELQ